MCPMCSASVTPDFHRATSQLFQRHLIRQNNRSYVLHNLYLVRNGQVFAQRSVDLPEFLHNSATIPSRAYHFPIIPSIIQFYFPVFTSVVEDQCGSRLTPIQARAIYVNGDEKNMILSGSPQKTLSLHRLGVSTLIRLQVSSKSLVYGRRA